MPWDVFSNRKNTQRALKNDCFAFSFSDRNFCTFGTGLNLKKQEKRLWRLITTRFSFYIVTLEKCALQTKIALRQNI